jgi:hypothetical protein
MPSSTRARRASFPQLVRLLTASVLSVTFGFADASAQGIGYEASPVFRWIQWDPALGISDTRLFGGVAGFHFGRALALQGYYLRSPTTAADPTILPPDPGFDPAEAVPELTVSSTGVNLVLNMQRTQVAPFIRAGGGLLRLVPRDGLTANQIKLNVGAGLRLGFAGEPSWEVFVEDWMVRVNRYQIFTPEGMTPPADPEAGKFRHNWAFGGAIHIPVGGDPTDPGPGLRAGTLALEPFGGRVFFARGLAVTDQNVFGGRAGIDLTRFVGARGYYWRGVDGAQPLQSYGGELQFTLTSGTGITPFFVAGAGHVDLQHPADFEPAEEVGSTALILGLGMDFRFAERFQARLAVHDYMLSSSPLEEVRRGDQIRHNPLVSAGFALTIGGGDFRRQRARQERQRVEDQFELLRQETERLRHETRELREALERRAEPQVQPSPVAPPQERPELLQQLFERGVIIPPPGRGEIHVRFGEPEATQAVPISPAHVPPAPPPAPAPPAQVEPAPPAEQRPAALPTTVSPPPADTAAALEPMLRQIIEEMIRAELQRAAEAAAPAEPR